MNEKRINLNVFLDEHGSPHYQLDNGLALSSSILSLFIDNNESPIKSDTKIYRIFVVIHSAKDLMKGQPISKGLAYHFGQDLLLADEQNPKLPKFPIIHISLTDAFVESMYSIKNPIPLSKDVPRTYQIMDSSIWNYLVPLSDVTIEGQQLSVKANFERAVKSICRNYDKGLYNLSVAKEYADLSARLVTESFLSGAHASGVSPFVFHSEGVMKSLIRKECDEGEINNKGICERKWRFLLVDDRAIEPMSSDVELPMDAGDGLPLGCKLKVLKNVLETRFKDEVGYRKYGGDLTAKDSRILIEYVETKKEALNALKEKKFDIILLDYLLEEPNNDRHYGYELLNEIYDDKKEGTDDEFYSFKNGPDKHFFFMFISAYSDAVFQRLLSEGLNLSEKYWYISTGACPTNTPQLFLYNLLKIMHKRLEDSGIRKMSTPEIIKVLNKIYGNIHEVRRNAGRYYQEVLSLQYHYRRIQKDVDIPVRNNLFDTHGSVLITEFVTKYVNMGGLLEHLVSLVHLTAFGSIRQWSEMWEEYQYFKTLLEQQPDKDKAPDRSNIYKKIESYILSLKSAAQ